MPLFAGVLIVQAAVAKPSAEARDCGSIDRNIGRGFILTQRMYGGTRDFELRFRPPAAATRTNGVKLDGPFELLLTSFVDDFDVVGARTSLNGPHLGSTISG